MLQPAKHKAPSEEATISIAAFLALGFRPFYLLGTLFAAVSVILWSFYWSGALSLEPALEGALWHAHEMLFGFVLAIVAGFLLTAVRVWTGQATPTGLSLAVIVGCWLFARLFMVTGDLLLAAIANALFLLLCAAAIAIPIVKSGNWRNLFAPILLLFFAMIDIAIFSAEAGATQIADTTALPLVASDLLTLLVALIGGRVIPFFTKSALPQAQPQQNASVEKLALGSLLLIALVDVGKIFDLTVSALEMVLLAAAFATHSVRLVLWKPLATLQTPLLWILMLSYVWLPVALLLRFLSLFDLIDPVLAMHALFSGLVSGLIIGMITRTARGHTARPLVAGPTEVVMFTLVHIAAIIRVLAPIAWPEHLSVFISVSAFLWAAAFLLYAGTYAPSLMRPRPDGKPG